MSTLNDLLRQVEQQDAQLAADLRQEVKALESRRAFGLNFERHIPETVELPGRPVRKGDKVRFLPERGAPENSVDRRPWLVKSIRRDGQNRVADLIRRGRYGEEPETGSRAVDDLVVVAEFRDPIYPGLVSTGKVERGGDKPYHSVINPKGSARTGRFSRVNEYIYFIFFGAMSPSIVDASVFQRVSSEVVFNIISKLQIYQRNFSLTPGIINATHTSTGWTQLADSL